MIAHGGQSMRIKMLSGSAITPATLEPVRRRLERWRRNHKFRSRLPEDIWASAVILARQHGLGKTARILRLDYYALKKRLEIGGDANSPKQASPAFVELISPSPNLLPECIIELEYPGGAKMRFQFNGKNAPMLSNVAGRFRSSEE
jgi:hypothetical protein